jgi:hypothetical protein
MSSNGSKAAVGVVGAAAAAAVFAGKELAHVAPQVAVHSGPAFEMAAKGGLAYEAARGGMESGPRSSISSATKSATAPGSFSSSGDISGSLGQTLRLGHIADAKLDADQQLGTFGGPGTGRQDTISKPDGLTSRPLIGYNVDSTRSTLQSYFSSAEPKLFADLTALTPPLSKKVVAETVRKDLVAAATSTSNVSFEVLTGKLKVKSSRTIGGLEVTGGEINLYIVGGAITGGVLTCNALAKASFKSCVDSAIRTAMANALKDLRPKAEVTIAD